MREQISQSITRNDIKILVAVITVVLAVAFAWADLKHATRNAEETAASAKEQVKEIAKNQSDMALDIREIRTILEQQGLTSTKQPPVIFSASPSSGESAKPTPSSEPQVIVNNYTQPTPTREPTPTITPSPSPTFCLSGICIGGQYGI